MPAPKKNAIKSGGDGKKGSKATKVNKAEEERQKRLEAVGQLKKEYIQACQKLGVDALPSVSKAIADAQVNELALNKIVLSKQSLVSRELVPITQAFASYNQVTALCLWRISLNLPCLSTLSDYLTQPGCSISILHLMDCDLTPASGIYLNKIAAGSPNLRYVNLDYNMNLGGRGAGAFFAGLVQARQELNPSMANAIGNSNLIPKSISIKWSDVGVECGEALSLALGIGSSVVELDLTGNPLSHSVFSHLSRCLASNQTLKVLNLTSTCIPPPYSKNMITSTILQQNGITLASGGNSGRDNNHLKLLLTGLSKNSTLNTLNLRGNDIGTEGGETILALLIDRKRNGLPPIAIKVTEHMSADIFRNIMEYAGLLNGGSKGRAAKTSKKKKK